MHRNWRDMIKPKRLEADEKSLTPTYGKFVGEPFERGYGTTIGNSLRRILLSSLYGAAITAVRIRGILHEFSTLPGVTEDVTDIVLNLKEVRVKLLDVPLDTIRLSVKGEKNVDGGRHRHRPAGRDPEPRAAHRHALEGRQSRDGDGGEARARLRLRRAQQGRGRPGRNRAARRDLLAGPARSTSTSPTPASVSAPTTTVW